MITLFMHLDECARYQNVLKVLKEDLFNTIILSIIFFEIHFQGRVDVN